MSKIDIKSISYTDLYAMLMIAERQIKYYQGVPVKNLIELWQGHSKFLEEELANRLIDSFYP